MRKQPGARPNRYAQIIETIFALKYQAGQVEVEFARTEIEEVASKLKIDLPRNLGDVVYSFRYRQAFPQSILKTAPEGRHWIIRPTGRAKYKLCLVPDWKLTPNPAMSATKIPDATPGLIARYALNDEQALLTKLRYNRLLDIFTGLTCYSLQNHLRTTVPNMGQVETDEIYLGLDRHGAHYVLPVQAKNGSDHHSVVQIGRTSRCASPSSRPSSAAPSAPSSWKAAPSPSSSSKPATKAWLCAMSSIIVWSHQTS